MSLSEEFSADSSQSKSVAPSGRFSHNSSICGTDSISFVLLFVVVGSHALSRDVLFIAGCADSRFSQSAQGDASGIPGAGVTWLLVKRIPSDEAGDIEEVGVCSGVDDDSC